jgi:hypothetical protein
MPQSHWAKPVLALHSSSDLLPLPPGKPSLRQPELQPPSSACEPEALDSPGRPFSEALARLASARLYQARLYQERMRR